MARMGESDLREIFLRGWGKSDGADGGIRWCGWSMSCWDRLAFKIDGRALSSKRIRTSKAAEERAQLGDYGRAARGTRL